MIYRILLHPLVSAIAQISSSTINLCARETSLTHDMNTSTGPAEIAAANAGRVVEERFSLLGRLVRARQVLELALA